MANHPVRDLVDRDRLVVASPADTVATAARLMAENACGCVLVMDSDKLVGIFTERDLVTRVAGPGKDLGKTRLDQVMSPEPETIRAEQTVQDAVRCMDEFSFRYLPVLEDGQVVGVLSTRQLPFGQLLGCNGNWMNGTRWLSGSGSQGLSLPTRSGSLSRGRTLPIRPSAVWCSC